ncbi:MAG: hypothetical protein U0670_05415 [Anaerolineae bacterium]
MDAEQRIAALEQELEILKNQIQATLLTIQEQLLSQSYPALRGETPAASKPTPVFSGMETETTEAPPATVKRVSLNPSTGLSGERTVEETQPSKDWQLLTRMESWASQKIEKIGLKRTRDMIRLYGQQGRITPQLESELLKFIAIYESGDAPAHPARSTGEIPRAKSSSAKTVPAASAAPFIDHSVEAAGPDEDFEKHRTILKLIAGVQNIGISSERKKRG